MQNVTIARMIISMSCAIRISEQEVEEVFYFDLEREPAFPEVAMLVLSFMRCYRVRRIQNER